jgi:hypothetical protein
VEWERISEFEKLSEEFILEKNSDQVNWRIISLKQNEFGIFNKIF